MCTITTYPDCLVAIRPIPCYKIMSVNKEDGVFTSALYGFKYTLGFTYRLDGDDFNSFPERNTSRQVLKIEKGFHSYQREHTAKFELLNYGPGEWAIVKCEIPKGARYWPGDYGMAFCSDSIKPVKWKKADESAWRNIFPAPVCQQLNGYLCIVIKKQTKMEEKKYCPKCGHEFVQGESDYNYETGDTVHTCPECGWEGTSALDRDKIKEDLAEELGEEWEVEEDDIDNVLDTIQSCESYEEAVKTVAEEIKEEEGCEDDDLSDKLETYEGSYNKRELKKNGLCIVTWPDSQSLCEMERFWEHAWLINDDYGLNCFGPCAYVVEEEWLNND